jgi:hypothetical protein
MTTQSPTWVDRSAVAWITAPSWTEVASPMTTEP